MGGDQSIPGGWLDGCVIYLKKYYFIKKNNFKSFILKRNFMQVPYQLLSVVVASTWAFILTFLILQVIGIIPIMRLKLSALEEEMYIFILFKNLCVCDAVINILYVSQTRLYMI